MEKVKIDKKKQDMLDNICAKLQKNYGKESITYLGNNKIEPMVRLSTQSIALDDATGGGWPEGRIIEIFGPESSGKSTLCYHAIAEAQIKYPDMPVALIDVENSFDPVYAQNLGINVAELLVSQPDTGTDALAILLDLINMGLRLVVVDSVAALVPKDEADAGIEDQQMGSQARLMSKAMRKITTVMGRQKTIVIFTNQIRQKIGVMFGDKTTTPGGNALKFYASIRAKTVRIGNEKVKDGEEIEASRFKFQIVKNKTAPPFRVVECIIRFGEGVDNLETIIDLALKYELIEKRGSWFSYKSEQLGQGRSQVRTTLQEDKKMYDEVLKSIKKAKEGIFEEVVPEKTKDVSEAIDVEATEVEDQDVEVGEV